MSCQNQDCRHGTGWGKFLNHYSGKLESTASLSEILGVVLPKPSFASMAIFVLYQINSGLMSWKSVICDWVTNHSTVKPWQTDFQSSLWLQDWISLPCDLIKNHYWIFMIFFKLLLKFISTYTEHELLILYSKSNMRAKLEAYKTWFPNKWSWSNMKQATKTSIKTANKCLSNIYYMFDSVPKAVRNMKRVFLKVTQSS